MSFTVTGIKEIDAELKKIEPKLSKKILRKALRTGAKGLKKEVQNRAPVDSGDLKKSVKVKAQKRSRSSLGVNVQVSDGDFKGDQYYAAMVEFGTSRMEAKPFMRPAFDSKEDETRKVIVSEIKKGLKDFTS